MNEVESRSCQWCERDVDLHKLKHAIWNEEPSCLDYVECQKYIDRKGVL